LDSVIGRLDNRSGRRTLLLTIGRLEPRPAGARHDDAALTRGELRGATLFDHAVDGGTVASREQFAGLITRDGQSFLEPTSVGLANGADVFES
jgi:hypothetical protein